MSRAGTAPGEMVGGPVAVLLFHHVGPFRDGTHRSLTVLPKRFESHMHALRRAGYTGVAAREWPKSPGNHASSVRREVILTFDDAYADLATFALPVLADVGFRATVFVVGTAIGSVNEWDAPAGAGGHRIMDQEDLRNWLHHGCEIGSHGMSHADLTKLQPEDVAAEVEDSQRILTALAGSPVTSFAYPYGAHDARVRARAMTRYERAFGTREGRNRAVADMSQLRRTMVHPADTAIDVLLRARLGWSPLERARTTVRPRTRARAVHARLRALRR